MVAAADVAKEEKEVVATMGMAAAMDATVTRSKQHRWQRLT